MLGAQSAARPATTPKPEQNFYTPKPVLFAFVVLFVLMLTKHVSKYTKNVVSTRISPGMQI